MVDIWKFGMILILFGVMMIIMDGTGVLMKVERYLLILMKLSLANLPMMYLGEVKMNP